MSFIWPKKRFSPELLEMGHNNLIMGTFGITEGAIPFMMKAPQLIIVNVLGGALGSATGAFLGVKSHIPPLGGLPGILTADNIFAYLAGIFVCALFIAIVAPLIADFTDKDSSGEESVSDDDIELNIQ